MSSVKRYVVTRGSEVSTMVYASDYDALAAELANERLRADASVGDANAAERRVAELEGLLKEIDSGMDLPPYFQHSIDEVLAGQPQQGEPCDTCDGSGDVHRADGEWLGECPHCKAEQPATHSGDERVIAEFEVQHGPFDDVGAPQWVRVVSLLDPDLEHYPDGTKLMTVAQHERIAADKDETIAHLVSQFSELHTAINLLSRLSRLGFDMSSEDAFLDELKELRAQPARQVGEAEPVDIQCEDAELQNLLNLTGDMVTGRSNQDGAMYWAELLDSVAARLLAPAAVAYQLDGRVIRTIDGRYVAELIGYDADLLRALLAAPQPTTEGSTDD